MITTVFSGEGINDVYIDALKKIRAEGQKVSPRGMPTRELQPAVTEILNPRKRMLTCYGRNLNPFFMAAEALWILSGRGDSSFITYYNSQMKNFMDEGFPNFHGCYGMRIRNYGLYKDGSIMHKKDKTIDQLDECYRKLLKDKDTRQAVMSIWNPYFDYEQSNDIPCNNLSMFKVRNGRLNLSQVVRSNDVTLGLFNVNIWAFSIVQETLAGWINTEVGHLIFFSDSLHSYDNQVIEQDVISSSSKFFDIYKYYNPVDARLPKQEFDDMLKKIMIQENYFRQGNFNEVYKPKNQFWEDLLSMIHAWSLRKHGKRAEAIRQVALIGCEDMKVVSLEYLYRNAKSDVEKSLVLSQTKEGFKERSYLPEVLDFIKGNTS